MTRYISIPLEVDPTILTEDSYQRLQELVPGWEPNEGNLDTWILQVSAQMAADLRALAKDIPDEIFIHYGKNILNIPPKLSSYATFTATFTAQDDLGYELPSGTVIGVRRYDGELIGFQTVEHAVIAPTETQVSGVVLSALEPGADASGLSTDESRLSLIDALPWVTNVVGEADSSGGDDGETSEEYMDRLVDEVRIMSPRPILPEDFGILARRVPGVDRAYHLNLYNADTDTADEEKCITLVLTDENGDPVSVASKTETLNMLEALREINMLIFVRDAQYQVVDVEYELTAQPSYAADVVEAAVNAELSEYISPKIWGEVQVGTERIDVWRPSNVVRYWEVVTAINNVEGVDFITLLELDGTTADVPLDPGAGVPVVLPQIGTITSTVTEGGI